MSRLIEIDENKTFARDLNSKAIVRTDINQYKKYKNERQQLQKVKNMEERLSIIEENLETQGEILNQIKELLTNG